jgi:methyltransferase-like protein
MLELSDWFLLHDHLEADNTAFYLHQFVERAEAAGLKYLGEADLAAMNLGALPTGMAQLGMATDMICQLQYLDLLQNRRFRMSLLCPEALQPHRSLVPARLWDFYWSTMLRPQVSVSNLEAAGQPLAFLGPQGDVRLRTSDSLSGAVFDTLCRQKLALTPNELVAETMRRFAITDAPALGSALERHALDLVMSNAISVHVAPETWVAGLSERPVASRLVRYQARWSSWVTNQRHEPVGVDPVAREVIRHVDGRHSRAGIIESIKALAERGRLNLQQDGRPITDRAAIARTVPTLVDQVLGFMAANALLVR